MKRFLLHRAGQIFFAAGILLQWVQAAEPGLQLALQPNGTELVLRWPASVQDPDGQVKWPLFEIQQSADLIHWQAINQAFRANSNAASQELTYVVAKGSTPIYYRLARQNDGTATASGGEAILGYASKLAEELQKIGQISPEDFGALYGWPEGHYLAGLGWDPALCVNWKDFMPVAGQDVAYPPPSSSDQWFTPNIVNFRLNEAESKVLQQQGFVASERLGAYSFPEAFYQVLMKDRPVFVSTDAILQAWHRSYEDLLEEMEEVFLAPAMGKILDGMAGQVITASRVYGNSVLKDSLLDADYFLSVARSLLAGSPVSNQLGQDARVAETLAAVNAQASKELTLFGEKRVVDFSQFTVRSHYNDTERLKRYFRMMMWCGRIDLRLTPAPPPWPPEGLNSPSPDESLRELGTAVVLHHLLTQSGQADLWQQCDQVINSFVGWSDSMTFAQLGNLLTASGIHSPADLPDKASLQRFQDALRSGEVGVQNILSDYYAFPLGPSQLKIPQSFAVLGQKFVIDSWALSQFVFPSVLWTTNGLTDKVMRRIPSALDVAFSVLGNDDCVPDIVARLTDTSGRKFRDGLPYEHNLVAMRRTIDQQTDDSWGSNMYVGWLAALRELSTPTTGSEYPDCMRTRAWAMKNLNTQLASWTHLRNATVLYAKQSYTGGILCSYPFGFVEPRPLFFQRLQDVANLSAKLLATLPMQGSYTPPTVPMHPPPSTVDLKALQTNQIAFLNGFGSVMATLTSIAAKELAQQPLSTNESLFLKDLIEKQTGYGGYRSYSGCYPGLFYRNVLAPPPMFSGLPPSAGWSGLAAGQACDAWDALATDVHTDVPADIVGDPGCVLHDGIGNVWMLITAINNGPDRMIYAGPVLSHYEFEEPADKRLTKDEWQTMIRTNQLPPVPSWVGSYLVPGKYVVPPLN
jgi:hypothetical protein